MQEFGELVSLAEQIACDFENNRSRESQQAVLGALYKITLAGGSKDGIISLPENRRTVSLARSLSELISDRCLEVRGRFSQNSMWDVSVVETGCVSCGLLLVGPDFEDEYKKRPDSMRAEMLFNMASAAFADSRNTSVGEHKSIEEVNDVIVSYLRTFPAGMPMTREQKYLISFC